MPFSDTFARANGPLGANWSVASGAPAILDGNAHAPDSAVAWVVGDSMGGAADLYAIIPTGQAYNTTLALLFKGNTGTGACYQAYVVFGTTTVTVGVGWFYAGQWYSYAKGSYSIEGLSSFTLRGTWASNLVSVYFNETLAGSQGDADYAANGAYGLRWGTGGGDFASFNAPDTSPASMTITPPAVWMLAQNSMMHATITGGAWSDVYPFDTNFSVDHGAVVTQTVESPTHGSFWFAPLVYTGTVTVTESKYGLSATFDVTSTIPDDYVPPGTLTQAGADILTRTSAVCALGHMLTTCDVVDSGPSVSITKALDAILEQLGGFYGQVGPDIGAVSLPSEIYELSKKVGEEGYWTAPELIELLGGSPTVYSNADLKTQIDLIGTGSNQDVLDALTAYFGASPPTIAQLGTMISDLATIAGYSLGDVKGWIDAIPGADLSSVTNKLALIQPSTTFDLSTITTQATAAHTGASAAVVALGALTGDGALTLQTVLDAIAAIPVPEPTVASSPPVWPGASNVTLGTPHVLADQLHIEAAMDGVIISVTTPPTKTGLRQIGGALYDYGVGELAFETDSGDIEMWQYLGFRAMIVTPKSMARAAGARFRVLAGASGTVTPWTSS